MHKNTKLIFWNGGVLMLLVVCIIAQLCTDQHLDNNQNDFEDYVLAREDVEEEIYKSFQKQIIDNNEKIDLLEQELNNLRSSVTNTK